MHRHRTFGILAACVLGIALAAQPQFDAAVSRQLAETILDGGRSYWYVSELTDTFGPRLTGSRSHERAAQWAAAQFREVGISHVATEPFTIARGWERGEARGRIVAPVKEPLHLASLGWTPSTPDGGVEGEVVAVTSLAPERVAAQTSLKGRVALIVGSGGGDAASRFKLRDELDARLQAAGAIAMLWPDSGAGNALSARSRGFSTEIGPLPAAHVGRDDFLTIRRLLEHRTVRVALEWRNEISSGPVTVNNVIAEIRGRERPDEWVVVGAHLDSWDFGTGAQDNGTGVAMVLEAARAITALKRLPRRSIRFALWGGEEQGLLGSLAYVAAHEKELPRCVAIINTDAGSGRVRGFITPGRRDVAAAMRPLSAALLAELGAAAVDPGMRYAFQSDHGPFILRGIPALDLNPAEDDYEEVHHKAGDTIGRVDRRNLEVGAAAVAIAAYAVADAERPIAPHLDKAGVAAMLAAARIDGVMQARGIWNPGP